MLAQATDLDFTRSSIRRTVAFAVAALVSWMGVTPAHAQKSCAPAATTTAVAGLSRWVESGITLSGGEIVTIKASGTWGIHPLRLTGPGGLPDPCPYPVLCPLQGGNMGALVAIIGDSVAFAATGVSFHNVGSTEGPHQTHLGELMYRMNSPGYVDSLGKVKVTTTVCYPATLYQEGYYTGEEIRITEDMSSLPLNFNDFVGSLRVASGWKIQVFVDTNYGGGSKTFTKDTVDLSVMAGASCPGGHWASCISSVKVSPK